MSLINQVLKDLEKRHASDPEIKSLPPHVRAVPDRKWIGGRDVVVLALIGAVVAGGLWWFLGAPSGQRTVTETRPVTAVPQTKPIAAAAAPKPAEVPTSVVKERVTEKVVQEALFKPVSRLSEELAVAPQAPLAAKKSPDARVARQREQIRSPTPKKNPETPAPAKAEARLSAEQSGPPPAATQNSSHSEAAVATAPASAPASLTDAKSTGVTAESTTPTIDKQMRDVTPAQHAEIAFRRGVAKLQEGRASAAEESFREALKEDPGHSSSRQALLGLMLDAGRNAEAEQLLRQALELNPRQPRHAMVLARLEVERGDATAGINTLVAALPYVQSDPEFFAFLAALLQRDGRHREAAEYYRAALRLAPGNGVWMMGLGISLRAANQLADARESFQRAAESKSLGPELQEFVERQLRDLGGKRKQP